MVDVEVGNTPTFFSAFGYLLSTLSTLFTIYYQLLHSLTWSQEMWRYSNICQNQHKLWNNTWKYFKDDTFIVPRLKPNNSYPILWGHRGYLKVISPFSGMYLVSFLLSLKRNPLMLVAPAPEARSTIADQGESCITITSECVPGPHWASEHSVENGFNESGWPADQAL